MPMILDWVSKPIENEELRQKFERLQSFLRDLESAVVAFSGGVDSSFLALACRMVLGPKHSLAALSVSPSLARSERVEAETLAAQIGIEFYAFSGTEFENPDYLKNAGDRCFHCKSDLYQHLAKLSTERGYHHFIFGGNLDDWSDFRPGLKAAEKYGALAPLKEAALSKADIRALSAHFGLPTAAKPAMPCLSSRIPYGSEVTEEKLAMIEAGEERLHQLGFSECRVRHEGLTARIEIPLTQMEHANSFELRRSIESAMRVAGFESSYIDAKGFRSGNLNLSLSDEAKKHLLESLK